MAGREHDRDPDDWWSSSGNAPSAPRSSAEAEDWLEDDAPGPAGRFDMLGDLRKLVTVVVIAAVALVAGLIASGVFAGGQRPPATTSSPPAASSQSSTLPPAVVLPPPPAGALTPGASGTEVKELQRALAALGFSAGAVDGTYGPATQQALKRFQRAHGLPADGVLGPKTLAALSLALHP